MFKSKREKELELKVERLEIKNSRLMRENEELMEKSEINIDLYNKLKAIMRTLGLREIEISDRTIEEVKGYEIYVEQSYMRFAETIKLIAPEQVINIENVRKNLIEGEKDARCK